MSKLTIGQLAQKISQKSSNWLLRSLMILKNSTLLTQLRTFKNYTMLYRRQSRIALKQAQNFHKTLIGQLAQKMSQKSLNWLLRSLTILKSSTLLTQLRTSKNYTMLYRKLLRIVLKQNSNFHKTKIGQLAYKILLKLRNWLLKSQVILKNSILCNQ